MAWKGCTYLVALVRRINIDYESSYEGQRFVYKVGDGPLEFLDVEQIRCQLGLTVRKGKYYIVQAKTAMVLSF